LRGNPRFGFAQKNPLTRLQETLEFSKLANLPVCEVCGKPYIPVPDPVEPLPFSVEVKELGWEMAIKRGDKIVRIARFHIKCDIESFEDLTIRSRVVQEAKEILRKMGFDPERVEWLR